MPIDFHGRCSNSALLRIKLLHSPVCSKFLHVPSFSLPSYYKGEHLAHREEQLGSTIALEGGKEGKLDK